MMDKMTGNRHYSPTSNILIMKYSYELKWLFGLFFFENLVVFYL